MAKQNFQQPLIETSVSYDPSEIILIYQFTDLTFFNGSVHNSIYIYIYIYMHTIHSLATLLGTPC